MLKRVRYLPCTPYRLLMHSWAIPAFLNRACPLASLYPMVGAVCFRFGCSLINPPSILIVDKRHTCTFSIRKKERGLINKHTHVVFFPLHFYIQNHFMNNLDLPSLMEIPRARWDIFYTSIRPIICLTLRGRVTTSALLCPLHFPSLCAFLLLSTRGQCWHAELPGGCPSKTLAKPPPSLTTHPTPYTSLGYTGMAALHSWQP